MEEKKYPQYPPLNTVKSCQKCLLKFDNPENLSYCYHSDFDALISKKTREITERITGQKETTVSPEFACMERTCPRCKYRWYEDCETKTNENGHVLLNQETVLTNNPNLDEFGDPINSDIPL